MSEWRPIDTAPKDGRTIEACDVESLESNMIVGWNQQATDNHKWTTGDTSYDKDMFTHWKEVTPQPDPPKT